MLDKNYTIEAKIEGYLGVSITSGDANNFILAAQAFIEKFTGRSFKADSVASARLYSGNDRQDLRIDDCVEVTKVEVGNNQWGDSFTEVTNAVGQTPEYYLMPINYLSEYAPEQEPIDKIGLRSRAWIFGHANHRITAKWGYAVTPPDDISFAATVIAAGMYYQNRGENTGAIKSERIGEYQVSYSEQKGFNDFEQAMAILRSYKKYEI